jgi:hypothetical protein
LALHIFVFVLFVFERKLFILLRNLRILKLGIECMFWNIICSWFGRRDGTVVAIGGPANSNPSPNGWYAGHAKVYRFNLEEANDWVQVYQFDLEEANDWVQAGDDLDGEHSGDTSGKLVSLSSDGQIIAIGAFCNDGEGQLFEDAGHVSVFQLSAGGTSTTASEEQ